MDHMERALSLARLALGHTSPNPAVGAVIVKNGLVISEGHTQPPGSAHAEIAALERAGGRARGATIYVSLEPCSHFGRTPPCARAIIAAGIAEVHLAMIDPNPSVSGRGRDELEEAGIKTHVGEREEEARELNEAYVKFITTGWPFVSAKFAMSLDGKIATRSGDSKWITGEQARGYVHSLRQSADAIMVGVNTVIADDPRLTARGQGAEGSLKEPMRVIVDSQGRIPVTAQVLREPGKTLVAAARPLEPAKAGALVEAGAEVLELPAKDGLVDLEELLRALGKREITSVLVEGGGTLLGSLFDQGLVDKVVAFIAPVVIGGGEAKTAVGGVGVSRIAQGLRLTRVRVERFGEDVMVSGYVESRGK
ncbi:MAG: bifunctional diaminohydroxyphosphoribosylaminopyrimidine deaminase/5-amino-6-(5-phosphoribosylamino)uracil reductase RibD [Dehalococcoidia bacterium]